MTYNVNKNKYSAASVANYIISLAHEDKISDLTQLKLIKLVYIVCAWHLALKDELLVKEPIEAWPYGPVLPSLYHSIKHHGKKPVDSLIREYDLTGDNPVATIPTLRNDDPEAWKIASNVWETYKHVSANDLVSLLHEDGSAWKKTVLYENIESEHMKEAALRGIEKYLSN